MYEIWRYPAQLKKIEAHIRRRLRARLVKQQKSKRNLFRKLVKRGVPRGQAAHGWFGATVLMACLNTSELIRDRTDSSRFFQ